MTATNLFGNVLLVPSSLPPKKIPLKQQRERTPFIFRFLLSAALLTTPPADRLGLALLCSKTLRLLRVVKKRHISSNRPFLPILPSNLERSIYKIWLVLHY